MRRLAAAFTILAVAAASPSPLKTRVFDDTAFQAIGRWERVHGLRDGRSATTSTRSYHAGDILQMWVTGTDLVLRGVVGPTGGIAVVLLDREPPARVDFYAPHKRTRFPVWARHGLAPGSHLVAITVAGRHDPKSRGNYVNVDDLEATGP